MNISSKRRIFFVKKQPHRWKYWGKIIHSCHFNIKRLFQTAADFRKQAKRIEANEGHLSLKWNGPEAIRSILRKGELKEELDNFMYIAVPQTKMDFVPHILRRVLGHDYHTHILLDQKS